MNLDLTAQFVRELEDLRKQVADQGVKPSENGVETTSASPLAEIEGLQGEIKRLEAEVKKQSEEVKRLEGEVKQLEQGKLWVFTQRQNDGTLHEAELKRLRAEHAEKLETARKSHAEELDLKEKTLKKLLTELARKAKEAEGARGSIEAELAKKSRELDVEARKRLASQRAEMIGIWNAKQAATQEQILNDVESRFVKFAYMPIGSRIAALIVDLLLLTIAGAAVRIGTAWGQDLSVGQFAVLVFGVFALRSFISPGNLLLGISPRHIGPDLRPAGPAGFTARFFCGLLHYGPLVATAYFAASDPDTERALMRLGQWLLHPLADSQSFATIALQLLKPEAPAVPGAVLALTLVWWSLLLVSILLSPLIHMGTPYFRNTTLVESMWRVGFQRFSPPQLKSVKIEP